MEIVGLEDREPDFAASVGLRIERATGDLLHCYIVVRKSLGEIFKPALDVGHSRRVWHNRRRQLGTSQGTYGTHCERVPCVKAAGVKEAQRSRPFGALVKKVEVREGLALVMKLQCADNEPFGLFSASQVVVA